MASLVKRCRHPRGEWESCGCTWYVRRRVAGRDTYTNVGADHAAARAALEDGQQRANVPLAQLVDEWLTLQAAKPGARPNSVAVYRSRARHVRAWFGGVPARGVRPDHLTRMVDALLAAGYAPATVQGVYSLATAVLRHGVRTGVLRAVPVPFDGPGIPTPRPRAHTLTLEQVEQVISRLATPWRQVAELVLLTGLRWGEAVAIEPGSLTDRAELFDVSGHGCPSITSTGIPAARARRRQSSVPRLGPRNLNAMTNAGPVLIICWLRIGPAALPCVRQSAGCSSTSCPRSAPASPAMLSAPGAPPWTITASGGSFSMRVRIAS